MLPIDRESRPTWYYTLDSRLLFTQRFAYIDTCTFLADRLFHEAGLKVSKTDVLRRYGEDYRIIVAKCRKKDFPKVAEALDLLPSKALVCGWYGYMSYCDDFLKEVKPYINNNGEGDD